MSGEAVISLILVTGLLIALGVLIRSFGMAQLIAGYDPDNVADKEGLTNFIGTDTLYVALLAGITAVFVYFQPFEGYQIIWLIFIFGVFGLTARMIRGARRFETTQ